MVVVEAEILAAFVPPKTPKIETRLIVAFADIENDVCAGPDGGRTGQQLLAARSALRATPSGRLR